MRLLFPILVLGTLVFFNSCEKNQKQDALIGTWKADVKDDSSFFSFSQKETAKKFQTNSFYSDTIVGKWEHKEHKVYLTYVIPKTYQIDSTVVTNDKEGNSIIDQYAGGIKVSTIKEGAAQAVEKSDSLLIKSLNDRVLTFRWGGKHFSYVRAGTKQGGLSFMSVIRGIFGIMGLILLTFLFSSKRKKIDWGLVIKGTAFQILIAILVLKVPFIEEIFQFVSDLFVKLIAQTEAGVQFLFGQIGVGEVQAPLITFAITVLPTIIFFSALMSMLYYLGVLQKFVVAFAWIMKKIMRLSGAESLAAAGNVFLGQTESPLLVKPYLDKMTKSELMCLMTGGMATIAGGVLAAYVVFLGGDDPVERAFFAKHLLTASVISAPAAIVAAKILVPETEEINQDLKVNRQKIGANLLEAIANGTTDGLKLAVNVGAMLLVFVALMALGNNILGWVGDVTSLNEIIATSTPYKDGLSFQFLLGYIGAPIVWMIGVEGSDMVLVGELLGQKTVLNEFVAYPRLGQLKASGQLSQKSVIIGTYILCGFANFASIGIQIGGIGSLIPNRKGTLPKLGMRALVGGTIASLMTAAIVGMFY